MSIKFYEDEPDVSGCTNRSESEVPVLSVSGLSLSYDGAPPLLENVSFDIMQGRMYCLMGANGCGKSTLINCILGMHPAEKGSVFIAGRPAERMRPKELARMIAFVPQVHQRTFPYTVEDVVLMGRSAYSGAMSGPGESDRMKVRRMLERTGIIHLKDRPYTKISGGELQLVMLARALIQDTPLVIMDEPSAHLDFRNELIFLENAASLIREENKSVIMATHSPNQPFFFERMGIDVSVLAVSGRRLRFSGAPSEVLTEENISEIYGIESRLMEECRPDGTLLRQIVPLRTAVSEGNRIFGKAE